MITAAEFIAKWGVGGPAYHLNEEQGAQSHFLDLCELLEVPKPSSGGTDEYVFERKSWLLGQARGYADIFYRDHFAWENKAPGKNLDTALKQLLSYTLALANPPLLVVCDRLTIRIHTQFNGHPSETHTVRIDQLDQPDKRTLLRRLWTDPESFRPRKTTRAITEEAAHSFATLADQLRGRRHDAEKVAHFLTQCLFCFFAEDVGLLPSRMFERLVANRQLTSDRLTSGLRSLFVTMRDGGLYGADDIPWFNGGLFKVVDVPKLETIDITELRNAAALNWSAIDVSIFGTLFERGLDPAKRSQLGAHYTDPATIGRIVGPVVERPLLTEWEAVRERLAVLSPSINRNANKGRANKAYHDARALFVGWLERLKAYRVLDPACGSGNFLYLALKTIKDVEFLSHTQAAELGLDREIDLVTSPHNILGIELNEYAAELARVTVWIGELQWRIDHGYEFKTNPVLEPLDHIECRDALLGDGQSAEGEAVWPAADAVVGNPPFLGDKWMRSELGDFYTDTLRSVYAGRVPGGADLVTYWFCKAGQALEAGRLKRAGLVATNSIRQRANRRVLAQAVARAPIFDAWSDLPWVNEGAAVRVSLVCWGTQSDALVMLDGAPVQRIHPDLKGQADGSVSFDLTTAQPLKENENASFFGLCLAGPFKVPAATAADWLRRPNPHGKPNSDVLKPIFNGKDVMDRWSGQWVIDFGAQMSEAEAALYEAPFEYVRRHVLPVRASNREAARAKNWWRLGRPRPELRARWAGLTHYIATVETAKHRVFVRMPMALAPEHKLVVVPRTDFLTLGLLSCRIHVVWAVAVGGRIGKGNDPVYASSACFESFPFPTGLTPADSAATNIRVLDGGLELPADLIGSLSEAAVRIARAARHLDELRQNWLNPPPWTHRVPEVVPLGMSVSPYPDRVEPRPGISEADRRALDKCTLTQLYNQRPSWLVAAHAELDAVVAAAYALTDADGADFWRNYSTATPDEAILARLLALNAQRAAAQGPPAKSRPARKRVAAPDSSPASFADLCV